jgi:hypothetical protein
LSADPRSSTSRSARSSGHRARVRGTRWHSGPPRMCFGRDEPPASQ